MKIKITTEQRKKILALLREGLDRQAIALSVGVTLGQVAAIAAHVTMQTYKKHTSTENTHDSVNIWRAAEIVKHTKQTSTSNRKRKNTIVNKLRIPIGQDTRTGESLFWTPTPESGTPNPHLLIVGESGSGKTYATQCVCAELAQADIPTIVFDFGQGFALDAAPPEFVEYAKPVEINAGLDGVNINPLQIFPSDIHGPVNVAQRVADTFARIYPNIGVQQHAVLRDAILQTFADVEIYAKSKNTWTLKPPRFHDLKITLDDMSQDKTSPGRRYASAVASHISTVFVFDTFRVSGLDVDWARILGSGGRTYILQLKGLEHLLERVVTELLLWNLIGYVESLGPGPLRCLVLLDEAHRLSFASTSPVEKLLREGRKFGIGVVLASQQPEDFSPVAFTNTASKLVFNVTDERGTVARQIARKSPKGSSFLEIIRQIGRLPRGDACFIAQDSAGIVQVTDFQTRVAKWRSVLTSRK